MRSLCSATQRRRSLLRPLSRKYHKRPLERQLPPFPQKNLRNNRKHRNHRRQLRLCRIIRRRHQKHPFRQRLNPLPLQHQRLPLLLHRPQPRRPPIHTEMEHTVRQKATLFLVDVQIPLQRHSPFKTTPSLLSQISMSTRRGLTLSSLLDRLRVACRVLLSVSLLGR